MAEEEKCENGESHDWIINENEKWTDTAVENGKIVVTAEYKAKTKTCSKCGKFIVLGGTVETRSGSIYTLEPDGTWGMWVKVGDKEQV